MAEELKKTRGKSRAGAHPRSDRRVKRGLLAAQATKVTSKSVEAPSPAAAAEVPPGKFTPTGRRRALLIGCVYNGTPIQLMGCLNDVDNIFSLLTKTWDFKAEEIRILREDDPDNLPTKVKICDGMRWLVQDVQAGDRLLFFFSGHGAQAEDLSGVEEDGLNETLIPLDFAESGMITDDEINSLIVRPLPEGAKMLAVLDCCSSGSTLDLPYTWTGNAWNEDTNPLHTCGDVQLLSGCRDGDVSLDTMAQSGQTGGAMTDAFCSILREFPHLSDLCQLTVAIQVYMRIQGVRQTPQLSSSQPFDTENHDSLWTIFPNMNSELGLTVRKRFKAKPTPPPVNLQLVPGGVIGVIMMPLGSSRFAVVILRPSDSE